MYETLILSVFPLMVMAAGISDFFTFKIPNWLNALIALSVIPFVVYLGMPLEVFAWHVVAGLLFFVIGLGLFAGGLIGGGDAKMLAACALWIGWDRLMEFGVITVLAGGALVMAMTAWQFLSTRKDAGLLAWAKSFLGKQPQLPYGIAIAAGSIVVFPGTWWLQQIS